MEKKDKNLNVPNLRFPEFSGEWESVRLGDVCKFFSGGTPSSTNKDFYGGDIPFIRSGEIHSSSTELYISEAGLNSSSAKIIEQGDLLLALYGATSGDIAISKIKGAINQAILCIRTNHDNFFLKSCWEKHCRKLLQTYLQGGQGNLSADIVKSIKMSFPSCLEQKKISGLLALIEERIETQKKIIEDLKKLKGAIAEKLFCAPEEESPELRIVNSSDRWISYRLKDVCQRVSERNSQGLSSLVLTIAAQYGLVSQTDFFNKSVASENLSNYYLIQKGDFAYNKSYSREYVWGAVKRLELYEKGVLSPLYICFRPNPLIVNSDFLSHYFETHKWHNGIAQIAGEGARNHGLLNVSISDYFATLHRLPGLAEQKKIASYLNMLSDKISLANKELKCYSSQKQYLLARMFI